MIDVGATVDMHLKLVRLFYASTLRLIMIFIIMRHLDLRSIMHRYIGSNRRPILSHSSLIRHGLLSNLTFLFINRGVAWQGMEFRYKIWECASIRASIIGSFCQNRVEAPIFNYSIDCVPHTIIQLKVPYHMTPCVELTKHLLLWRLGLCTMSPASEPKYSWVVAHDFFCVSVLKL